MTTELFPAATSLVGSPPFSRWHRFSGGSAARDLQGPIGRTETLPTAPVEERHTPTIQGLFPGQRLFAIPENIWRCQCWHTACNIPVYRQRGAFPPRYRSPNVGPWKASSPLQPSDRGPTREIPRCCLIPCGPTGSSSHFRLGPISFSAEVRDLRAGDSSASAGCFRAAGPTGCPRPPGCWPRWPESERAPRGNCPTAAVLELRRCRRQSHR